jgi:AraC family transcriptional regulator of adaptative response/methylated-DNA-[protein]-cysteine methyltransferase
MIFQNYFNNSIKNDEIKMVSKIETVLTCELKWSNQLHHLTTTSEVISFNNVPKVTWLELIIEYGCFLSPFGKCLLAKTKWGICKLAFFDTGLEETQIEKELNDEWRNASLIKDNSKIKSQAEIIFSRKETWRQPLQLLLKGTQFQLDVWKALLALPANDLVSYEKVAASISQPKAVRAVASAVAHNKIAYLVPCHRVIRKNGDLGQYRWKAHRKKELITWDISQ